MSTLACRAVLGIDDDRPLLSTTTPSDDGGADGGGGEADFYVSVKGDDANDGTRARPVRSLRKAVELAGIARTAAPGLRRIAICAGDYPERPLVIRGAIEVRGSYDCSSWTREPIPANRLREPDTRLFDEEKNDSFVDLRGDGTGAPRLDNLSIRGSKVLYTVVAEGEVNLARLSVSNTTVPLDDRPLAAVGANDAKLTVESSFLTVDFTAGSTSPDPSGVVIISTQSTVTLRQNELVATNIPGTCIGALIEGSEVGFEQNIIELSRCARSAGKPAGTGAAIGYGAQNSKVKSVRNSIRIDRPDGTGDLLVAGVNSIALSGGTASLDSDGDRIMGPQSLGPNATSLSFAGFLLGAPARVVNASILLDGQNYAVTELAAIGLSAPLQATIAHNSIYVARSEADAGNLPLFGIVTVGAPEGVAVEGNLVVSDNPRVTFAKLESCTPDGGLASFVDNLHAGVSVPFRGAGSTDCGTLASGTNRAIPCTGGGCGMLFESTAPSGLVTAALQPTRVAACPGLNVATSRLVATDATGKPRGDGGTTAGSVEIDCN
jgi:hypothetical protein